MTRYSVGTGAATSQPMPSRPLWEGVHSKATDYFSRGDERKREGRGAVLPLRVLTRKVAGCSPVW
jgi:hypothetical protein